jgi:hypothetical protein
MAKTLNEAMLTSRYGSVNPNGMNKRINRLQNIAQNSSKFHKTTILLLHLSYGADSKCASALASVDLERPSLLPLNLNSTAQLEVIIVNTTVRGFNKAMARVHENE